MAADDGQDPRLVIFDCDGVLVDSEALSCQVLAEAITTAGWSMTGAQARQAFIGCTLAQVEFEVVGQLGRPLPAGWLEDLERQRSRVFEQELKPVNGVKTVLETLRAQGIEVCVASQGRPQKIALSLHLTGLAPFFLNRMFSAYDVARPKPAPDLFLHAASSLGHSPESCVVIEDTVLGVKAGVAANMKVLAFAADSDASELDAAGGTVFTDMAELLGLLGVN